MNTHEPKNSHMNSGIQPLMGQCRYEAQMFCLHNNTHSPTLTEVNMASRFQMISAPWELKRFAYFRKNGRTKCWHKVPLLLHQKHKHFCKPSPFVVLIRLRLCVHRFVGSVQTKPVQESIESLLSAQTGFPGRAEQPPWLAVTRRQSLGGRPSVKQNARLQRNELNFGGAKLFASKLQNFHSGRITPENGSANGCLSLRLFHSSSLLFEMWDAH